MTEEPGGKWKSKRGTRRLAIFFWGKTIVFVIYVAHVLIYSWTASTINEIKDSFQKSSSKLPL